jgi:excisionase family DNA binding protein
MIDYGYDEPKERKYDSVMTVKEMTDYLNISKTYAYQLLEKKEIPHIKFGRTYRILKDDLDKYCQQNRVKVPGKPRRS